MGRSGLSERQQRPAMLGPALAGPDPLQGSELRAVDPRLAYRSCLEVLVCRTATGLPVAAEPPSASVGSGSDHEQARAVA